jgi:multisubunit Na+/H+ antiporter MnhB subunit
LTAALGFDALLCLLIVGVAASAVLVRDLFAAIVFFIVYGVFAAIAWVRLDATDVALAEAAIGAGLTGILLVGAAARVAPASSEAAGSTAPARPRGPRGGWGNAGRLLLCGLAAAVLAGALAGIVLDVPRVADGLAGAVADRLGETGVGNPVTAVLLDFRSYDTLLETMVLLIAVVGVWSLTEERFWGGRPGLRQHARPGGVLAYFGRVLPPLGLVVGIHLLWAGAEAPGGAFQAGTVLASVWLLAAMAGLVEVPAVTDGRVRLALVVGPAAFLLFGIATAAAGRFLDYPVGFEKTLILIIEVLVTLSIAVTLSLVVLGVPRRPA